MLAYLFWHRPRDTAAVKDYEQAQVAFLPGQEPEGPETNEARQQLAAPTVGRSKAFIGAP